MNQKLLQVDDPYLLMNHAEVEFLLAEAAVRGIGGVAAGTAQAHYEAGVKSAMQMYTRFDATLAVDDAKVTAYLAARPFPAADADRLKAIGTQMWAQQIHQLVGSLGRLEKNTVSCVDPDQLSRKRNRWTDSHGNYVIQTRKSR